MNPITELYKNLHDDELKIIIEEIRESEKTGVFGNDSEIRKLCRKISEITGMDNSSAFWFFQCSYSMRPKR